MAGELVQIREWDAVTANGKSISGSLGDRGWTASCWGCRGPGEHRSHWLRPWASRDPESDKHLSSHRRSWGATEWPWGDLMSASSSPVAAMVVRGCRLLRGSWEDWPLEASAQWPPLLGLTFCQFFENSLWGALALTAPPSRSGILQDRPTRTWAVRSSSLAFCQASGTRRLYI